MNRIEGGGEGAGCEIMNKGRVVENRVEQKRRGGKAEEGTKWGGTR